MKYKFIPTFSCTFATPTVECCLAEVKEHCSFYICSEANKMKSEKSANYYEEASEALRKERILENYSNL